MDRRHIASLLALALAACGGGGGGTSGGGGGGGGVAPTPTTVVLAIVIPSVGPSETKRPLFVDPSTNQIAVSINGTPVTTGISTGCTPTTPATCTESFPAPAGSDTFDIQLGANNAVLSHGTVTAQIPANQTTTLHLTFHGVVTAADILADNPAPKVGAPSTIHLTLNAFDAAGNQIIGDDYDTPVTIAATDPTGHMQLAANVFRNPTDILSLAYDGRLMTAQAHYAAGGAVTARSTLYVLADPYTFYPTAGAASIIAPGANGTMWFADCYPDQTCAPSTVDASGHVTEFARVGVIGAIALGPDGNAWFSGGTQNPNVYRVTPTGTITTFVVRSIGPSEAYETHAIVAGPDGNMWLAEGDRIDKITMAGVVTHYLLANYYRPQSLTLGPDGRLWFDDDPEVAAIDMSGTISHYTLSQARDTTSRAAWGSDGLLHFNAFIGGAPGGCYCTMTTAGTEGAITLAPGTGPGLGMVTGPNGNIWYVGSANVVEQGTNSTLVPTFSFVDATGRATSYPYYDPTSGVIGGQIGFQDGIANSTDGTLWAAYNGGVVKFTNDP